MHAVAPADDDVAVRCDDDNIGFVGRLLEAQGHGRCAYEKCGDQQACPAEAEATPQLNAFNGQLVNVGIGRDPALEEGAEPWPQNNRRKQSGKKWPDTEGMQEDENGQKRDSEDELRGQ